MVAVLPGTSTLEMTFTSAKFEPELFAMTNAAELATSAAYEEYATENLTATVADELDFDLGTKVLVTGSIAIKGMTEVSTAPAATGEFQYDSTNKKLKFFAGDVAVGTIVEVSYRHTVTIQEMKVDNRAAAIGEVVAKYPVYSDGTDCTAAGIIGYAFLKVYQARITSQPTLGGSYKSASTYDFTISAIDPKGKGGLTENGTEAVYSIGYKANA